MKLKFETTLLPDDYVREVWKKYPKGTKLREFAEAIDKMKIGESFEVEGVYNTAEIIRQAFKSRGWTCTCRATRRYPEKIEKGLRVFKIRAWRLS
jgi:hypothetical protein